jgi:glycosyltransferase involved in cell wall biosynthesis
MKISIITVCYNSAETIADTLSSVANQSYHDIEHIIIDGASNDGTLNFLRKWNGHKLKIFSGKDKGIYDAMNRGIALCSGSIIGILNSDDFYATNDVLHEVSEVFLDPDVDGCYADLLYVKKNNIKKIVRYWKSRDFQFGLFGKGWMPAHPTFFVRKKVYEKFGVFDLSYPRQADFELTLRFLEINRIKTSYVPKVWVKMRKGGVSNRGMFSIVKANLESYRACLKHGLNISIFFIPLKIISRIPQYFKRP